MTVVVVASTQFHDASAKLSGWESSQEKGVSDSELIVELGGRICYMSFDRPNPKTRANADYIKHILEVEHYSILEHANVTVEVSDVSRNLLIELSRHRHISLSVVSSRYVDMTQFDVIVAPALRDRAGATKRPLTEDEIDLYEALVELLIHEGKTRKEAREAAAMELPGGIETRFVMTANLRTWREIIQKRWNVHANAEIREWAGDALEVIRPLAPAVFQDFPSEPFSS